MWETRRKEPLGRQLCTWVDNIKTDLGEIGWGVIGWISLVQDMDKWWALINMIMALGLYA
jgi:hypothetical protein